MGLLLAVSRIYVPRFLQKRQLEMLFEATAEAFRVTVPSTAGLSYDGCLRLYARFTREQAAESIQQGHQLEVQSRLFQNASRIGQQIKREFQIHTLEETLRMSEVVYRILRIDFRGDPQGNIVVRRCFFSAYYSRDVCSLVSSLDAGLLAGLSGGGKLSFSQRITEGHDNCRAYLDMTGRIP
jgi:hypothetical protein